MSPLTLQRPARLSRLPGICMAFVGLAFAAWTPYASAGGVCQTGTPVNIDSGLQFIGDFAIACEDGDWGVTMAFPFTVQANGTVDTARLTLSFNTPGINGGGDVYVTGSIADATGMSTCGLVPNINDIRATLCCGLVDVATGAPIDLVFPSAVVTAGETVWVLLRWRTGSAFSIGFDGDSADDAILGRMFLTDLGTGLDDDWVDIATLGAGFSADYAVELLDTGGKLGDFSCPTGLDACGFIAAGDCFAGNGTPSCNNELCCLAVCEIDPGCCLVEWTENCAGIADVTGDCFSPNDDCVNAIRLTLNTPVVYDNSLAATDGPANACIAGDQIESDLWYLYTADSDGDVVVDLCGSDYDSKLAVYVDTGVCPPVDDPVVCNDDSSCSLASQVMFTATAGTTYLIRAGSFAVGDGGNGVLEVRLAPTPQPCPVGPGGIVLLDQIGPDNSALAGVSPASQIFGDANAAFTIGALDNFEVPPGGDVTLSCFDAAFIFRAGFSNPDVANIIDWRMQIYSSVAAGATGPTDLTGDVASVIIPAGAAEVTLTIPFATAGTILVSLDLSSAPGPGIVLSPGTYWVALTPRMDFTGGQGQIFVRGSTIGDLGSFQINPGGGFGFTDGQQPVANDVAYRLVAVGGGKPCPADFDLSGAVDVKDLLFLLGAWGPCPKQGDCPADFDNSSAVDVKDLLFLLGAWGPCP